MAFLNPIFPNVAFKILDINRNIVYNSEIDGRPVKAYVSSMKPLIPSDATSKAVGADAHPEREDPSSLHDEILTRLRDYIVEGNIPDGGRVPERQLCEMLGISRTPLREALKVLASEGLVELLPNRGARVRQLSGHDLGELFDVMGGLEGLAGRLACENITDAEIAEIERLHTDVRILPEPRRTAQRVNQLIHHKIDLATQRCEALTPTSPAGSPGPLLLISLARSGRSHARTRPSWMRCVVAPVANSATFCLYICVTSGPPPLNICGTPTLPASRGKALFEFKTKTRTK